MSKIFLHYGRADKIIDRVGGYHNAVDLLSGEERNRHRSMHVTSQSAFMAGRLLIKQFYAGQYQTAIDAIHIEKNSSGKPYISRAGSKAVTGGDFSLSHTRVNEVDYVACAFWEGGQLDSHTTEAAIGLDIENKNRQINWRRMIERRLSEQEQQAFHKKSDQDAQRHFFRTWTVKEAIVKAKQGQLLHVLRNDHLVWPNFDSDGVGGDHAEPQCLGQPELGLWSLFLDDIDCYAAVALLPCHRPLPFIEMIAC